MDQVLISDDPSLLQPEVIHDFLRKSYWAEEIPFELVKKSIDNSLCFGVYIGKKQIGFARVITDKATFAYLADVFIVEEYRGKGLAKKLMSAIRNHGELQQLRRWMLATRDAHGLYSQFGFTPLKMPERMMEISNPKIYILPGRAEKTK